MKTHILLSLSFFSSFLAMSQNYRYGIFSPEGKKITELELDNAHEFSENLAVVTIGNKYGYINTEGKLMIPKEGELSYDEAEDFRNGLAVVKKQDKYGVIDKQGNLILPIQYDRIEFDFNGKFAKVTNQYKCALMTEKGKFLTEFKYLEMTLDEFPLPVSDNQYRWGYLNAQGIEIIKPQYEGAWNFQDRIAVIKKDGLMGLIDEKGDMILSPKYEVIERRFELITAYNGDKFGVLSPKGQELTPLIYSSVGTQRYGISDGMLAVEREGKWGFLNTQTWTEIALEYDNVRHFSEGFAAVSKGGAAGFINKLGKPITAFKYESIDDFSEGMAAVSLNGKWGYIDQSGKEVIPLMYQTAHSFDQGRAAVQVGESWKEINKQNQIVSEKTTTLTSNTYAIKLIEGEGICTFVYPKLNLKVEKYWDGFGDAHDGKLTDLSSQQLLGENIVFDNGKIVKGDFYEAGKKFRIEDLSGIPLKNIREKVLAKAAEPPKPKTQAEIVAANNAYIEDLEELQRLYSQKDKFYLDILQSDISLDDTPSQTEAKRIARYKPYIQVMKKIQTKLIYLIEHPETKSDYKLELLKQQKKNDDDLTRAQK